MKTKTRIRIGILVIITCVMCFSDWSFAVDGNAEEVGTIAWTLNFIVSCLSRFWVIFANIAGKFLNNSWVYGEALGIDVLLWKYWNIVKNMANFCLGFYLVYVIFKGLVGQGKESVMNNLKKVLLWVLIAGVGIQASWFLTSVVVDLSTVVMSAVGAFPAQVLSKDENFLEGIEKSMKDFFAEDGVSIAKGKLFSLFPKDGAANSFTQTKIISLDTTVTEEKFLDNLMPNQNDVSGPLYYMGFAILRTQELNSIKSYREAGLKGSILNLIVQGGTTVIYSVEMGVLCVIALMRILYLWMFIVLSPFAILLACIGKAGEKDLLKMGFIVDLMKQINLKTFLAKTFQPAVIVFGISISMIFVTLVSKVVNNDNTKKMEDFDMGGVKISSSQDKKDTTSDDTTYTTMLEGNLLKFSFSTVGKGILDLMMSIMTVILVYMIINMGIKIGNKLGGGQDFLSKKIESVQKGVEGAIGSVPLVPVAGYDKEGVPTTHHISVGKTFGLGGKDSLITEGMRRVSGKIKDEYDDQNKIIDSWFGKGNIVSFKSEDQRQVENSVSSMPPTKGLGILETQFQQIVDMGKRSKEDGGLNLGEGYGMVLNPSASNRWWQGRFENWLKQMKDNEASISGEDATVWKDMIKWWRDNDGKTEQTLENLFKNNASGKYKSVKAYAKLFKLGDDISNWNELKNADISMKK